METDSSAPKRIQCRGTAETRSLAYASTRCSVIKAALKLSVFVGHLCRDKSTSSRLAEADFDDREKWRGCSGSDLRFWSLD